MSIANRAPLASLALVGALAVIVAVTGCNSSGGSGPGPAPDGGPDGTVGTACVTPTFSPAAGQVPVGSAVTLTATGLPTNGFIYYTTDSTMPTHASQFVASGGTITISQAETITAIAYATGACADSAPATATYTVPVSDAGPDVITTACAAPTFTPAAGTIDVGSTVTIVPPADFPTMFPQGNATIFFTVDGTIPTHASQAYSGPIQVNTSETIRAIAYYPGTCSDSSIALASYTVTLSSDGGLAPPAFNPPSATQSNDFLVQLTDNDPAATICFTFGTGIPTCSVTATGATCSGTSQTYNAGAGLGTTGSVTINGAVTSNTTGTVTVNAIGCAVGGTTTTSVAQTYTLKGAAPTMQGPAPSATLPFLAAPGYAPTLASSTTGSTVRYTTDGSTPTCNTGNLLGGNPFAVTPFTGNMTFNAITCKNGYAPSLVGGPFTYGVVLPTPAFVDATTTTVAEGTGTYDGAPTIAFTDGIAAGTPGLYYCSTTDSSAPTCGATAGVCGHGTAGATLAVIATGTVVNVVACAPSNTMSAAGTATYTLQLDPPALALPGCTETNNAGTSCFANPPTTAVTSYDIPATAAATFQTFIEETLGTLPPSVATQPTYQFVCVQQAGTPSCSATGCSAGATLITPAAANGFKTAGAVPLAAAGTVVAGNTWSIIGCPGSTSTGFLPSDVTTVGFALPGAAPSPVVVAGTKGGTYMAPVTPAFTNSGTTAETICYGTYPTATPPTTPVSCTAAGTCATTAGYTSSPVAGVALPAATPGATTTVASIAVTSGGVGYTSAPTVVVANPPVSAGALTAQGTAIVSYSVALPATPTTGGAGCSAANPIVTFSTGTATATATINAANVVTGLTVTNAGSGYTTAPTPVWTNLNCTTAPTVTPTLVNGVVTGVTVTNPGVGYTTTPSVTLSGGGATTAATATAALAAAPVTTPLPVQQTSGVSIDVVGCISGSPTSPLQTYTYNFAEATPTVTDATVPVVGGSTVPLGDTLVLATSSTFTAPPDICYTTDGTAPNPACATAGTTICAASPVSIATTSTTFTTNTLNAIACNPASQTVQTNSAAYTAALNLVVATPTPSKAGGTYYNLESPTLSTTTPHATICYTTVGAATPTCAAGVCTSGSTTYAGAIPVTATGTVLKAIACVGAYTSAVSTNTYTYDVTPIILSNVPVLPLSNTAPATCPAAIDIGLDCSEGTTGGVKGCSTATFNAGGKTVGATVCYSTTVAVTSCAPATGVTCTGAPDFAVVSPTQDTDLTINALACAPGFSSSSATFTITATPYSNPVTFTGVPATDFAVTPINENQVANSAGNGDAYFSLTATTLYFGLDTVTPSATTYTTIYIGNGSTTNAATATTSATGSKPLNPAEGIQYAIQFPTAGTTATLLEWAPGTASWVAAAGVPTVNATGTAEEFSIALSALPQLAVTPATNVTTALGAVVDGAGTVGAAALFSFPGAGADYATHWFAYPTASCLYPNAAGAIH
jgi:hypothetical protein